MTEPFARALQVTLTKQGIPAKALQAIRMLLASKQARSQKSAADFEKQSDLMHEETCLEVIAMASS